MELRGAAGMYRLCRAGASGPGVQPGARRRLSTPGAAAAAEEDIKAAMTRRPAKVVRDYLVPMPSHLLSTTLGDILSAPGASLPVVADPPAPLPQGHHLVYFPLQAAASALAPDGADTDHVPPLPGAARRLWAGGAVRFAPGWRARLRLDGRPWTCREHIDYACAKGRSVLVGLRRTYALGHGVTDAWDIEERRTLVFLRGEQRAPRAPPRYAHAATVSAGGVPQAAHLFHFSALTYNAHGIHVDGEAARADGHRARLVHGPLALALVLRVLGGRGPVRELEYRNHAPLYVGERLRVCARRGAGAATWRAWVEGPDGGLAVTATAEMADEGEAGGA